MTALTLRQLHEQERQKRGLEFLLTLVLPLLVAFVAGERILFDREETQVRALAAAVDAELREAIYRGGPAGRIESAFAALARQLESRRFEAGTDSEQLPWPSPTLGLTTVVFNERGQPWTAPGEVLPSRYVLTRLWADLLTAREDTRHMELYRTLLGRRTEMWRLRAGAVSAAPITKDQRPGFIRWQHYVGSGHAGGLLMIMIAPPPDFALAVDSSRRFFGTSAWAVFDPESGRSASGEEREDWGHVLMRSLGREADAFVTATHVCRARRHPNGLWLLRAVPHTTASTQLARQRLGFFTFAAMLLLVWLWFVTRWSPLAGLGLSSRVLVMLVLAGVLPLAITVAWAITADRGRQAVLLQRIQEENTERLRGAERGMLEQTEILEQAFARIARWPSIRAGDPVRGARIGEILFNRQRVLSVLKTYAQSGAPLLQYDHDRAGNLLDSLPRHVMPHFLGVRKDPTGEFERLTDEITLGPMGMSSIMDVPARVSWQGMGRDTAAVYFELLEPSATAPVVLALMAQGHNLEMERFFRHRFDGRCYAFSTYERRWMFREPAFTAAQTLLARTMVGRDSQHLVEWTPSASGSEARLWTALPCTIEPEFCLMTSQPLTVVWTAMASLRWMLVLVALLTAALAIGVAAMLSRELLGPIGAITRGLTALERRDLQVRLPRLPFEFGEVAAAFNAMMVERHDLDLAREVQRHIMPREIPCIAGYDLTYSCRSLTDVGGDYCDILPCADGRWLVLIGDVTGHGIGAALITTMVKTLAVQAVAAGDGLPVLFRRLNKMMLSIMRRMRNVTLAALLLDPGRHEIEWLLAGHPPPMLRHADGRVEELEMNGFPLGCVKSIPVVPKTTALPAGSALVVFTDGYTESLDPTDDMLGYQRWTQALSEAPVESAQSCHDHLVAVRDRFAQGVPANDDLTMLVMKRGAL